MVICQKSGVDDAVSIKMNGYLIFIRKINRQEQLILKIVCRLVAIDRHPTGGCIVKVENLLILPTFVCWILHSVVMGYREIELHGVGQSRGERVDIGGIQRRLQCDTFYCFAGGHIYYRFFLLSFFSSLDLFNNVSA